MAARIAMLLMAIVVSSVFGTTWLERAAADPEAREVPAASEPDRPALGRRFAPILYLNPAEPFRILAIIPVFHPSRPLIAYHVFFEEDALFAGRGKASDHEIVWVAYDPATLEITDVCTLWHYAVLRTDACVAAARASDQRPWLAVQWGQHGILPLGWEAAPSLRTRFLLRLHYFYAKHLGGLPGLQSKGFHVSFRGDYADYLHFTEAVDVGTYLEGRDVVVAEHSAGDLAARFHRTFKVKKEWPEL